MKHAWMNDEGIKGWQDAMPLAMQLAWEQHPFHPIHPLKACIAV
jgi:hypothetical protein